MKPPKCRLCGKEHWNSDPHDFNGERNQPVTKTVTKVVTCNQCVTKDAEIEWLRNQLAETERLKPKRDRAAYMRGYRKKPLGIAYG